MFNLHFQFIHLCDKFRILFEEYVFTFKPGLLLSLKLLYLQCVPALGNLEVVCIALQSVEIDA